jgi:hypothetical protein
VRYVSQMNTTEWTLPASVKGPQVGQLLAGRYRLALFKGGDDIAEVWHAVEESTQQVVSIEILRDRGDEGLRTRFLEQAKRMAQIERPSVMKVAAIHDDANETFVVFEHLIPLSIELPDLTPAEPAAAIGPEPATSVAVAAVPAIEPPALEWITPASLELETVPSAEPDALAPTEPETVEASAPTVLITRRSRPRSLRLSPSLVIAVPDVSVLIASATRLAERSRTFVGGLRLDRLVTAAKALIPQRIDRSLVETAAGRLVKTAGPLVTRARHNQIVMAVVTAAVVLAVFVASPLDDAIANALRPKAASALTTAPNASTAPTAPLSRAPFEVPPLTAYGASFEAQGPYPTAAPNATVEWVVALRNTGSVGWYRGIEGAQVALALADGTGVAVQSTPFVAPGQVGWFVVHFRARAEPGTYNVSLIPRVDGRGPLPDLGIHAVVTVSKNP